MRPTLEGTGRFEELQQKMAERLGRRGLFDLSGGTIVVLPSITFPESELKKIVGIEHYEERMLCMTLLLSRPTVEIVYVSSMPISESVLDYYLGFTSNVDNARRRLRMVSVGDPSPRALSKKLLEDAALLEEIRAAVSDIDDAYLFPFNVTEYEQEISGQLGIPVYGPHPQLAVLGSKSGARKLAQVAGVPVPLGAEDLYSLDELEQAVFKLGRDNPDCDAVVIKLNNGFSGQGNAILELGSFRAPIDQAPVIFCAAEESWPSFAAKIVAEGAVVEQLIRGEGVMSPSVQLRIFPDGDYEVVSTHDQILGGPDEQVYLGCRFPAQPEYRHVIQAYGLGIARELAAHGVIGSFGADFIVVPGGQIFMSEINLRLGGTTHPFLMARFATNGAYDIATGELRVGDGTRCYVATDNIKSPKLVGAPTADLIALLRGEGLAFDPVTGTGVTLHLLGATERYGKLGAVCIERTGPKAEQTYGRLLALFQ